MKCMTWEAHRSWELDLPGHLALASIIHDERDFKKGSDLSSGKGKASPLGRYFGTISKSGAGEGEGKRKIYSLIQGKEQ